MGELLYRCADMLAAVYIIIHTTERPALLQVRNILCNKNNILLFSNKLLHVVNDNVPSADGFGFLLV